MRRTLSAALVSAAVAFVGALPVTAYVPQRLGVRVNSSASGGPIVTAGDVTLLGYFHIPGLTNPHPNDPGADPYRNQGGGAVSACGTVSGVVHCLTDQMQNSNYGGYSLIEYIDPGSYGSTPGTATDATYYRNWGWSGGAQYDMYHGKFGYTYNNSGVLTDLCGFGGNACIPSGLGYHEVGGVRYIYISYGLPYGNPPTDNGGMPYNLVICSLDNPGTGDADQTGLATTCSGPYRVCAGTGTYGGTQFCGPWRGSFFSDLPTGKMGSSNGYTYTQNPPNWGPSLWGGLDWPTTATTDGFGSTRAGNAIYRTTDLVQTVDYLSHYQLSDGQVNLDGTLNGVPQWSGRRPSYPTATLQPNPPGYANYAYEGGSSTTYGVAANSFQNWVLPSAYSGVGSWVNGDITDAAAWITGTKEGVLFAGHFAVGPVWYKTRTAQLFSPYGTGSNILFMRGADEAWSETYGAVSSNTEVRFDVAPANYSNNPANVVTVKYQNDGASQSLSCTASGKVITVHLATNGSSVITSTANAIIANINTTSACYTLATASIGHENDCGTGSGHPTCPGGVPTSYINDGTGVVSLITVDYSHTTTSPSGVLILAYGPQYSPIEGTDLHVSVTGPVSVYEAGIMVYDPATLEATPDYNVTPTEFIWPRVIDANFPCATIGAFDLPQCNVGGFYFNPTTRKLYLFSNQSDLFGQKPTVAVFQIAGSPAPEPTLLSWLWSLAPNWLHHSHSKPISLLERPR